MVMLYWLLFVEFPNFDAGLEMGSRSGRWLHDCHETSWANSADRTLHGPSYYWGEWSKQFSEKN